VQYSAHSLFLVTSLSCVTVSSATLVLYVVVPILAKELSTVKSIVRAHYRRDIVSLTAIVNYEFKILPFL
jgi:hypothetical protein